MKRRKMTPRQQAETQEAISNLKVAIEELKRDGASEAAIAPYRQNLAVYEQKLQEAQ